MSDVEALIVAVEKYLPTGGNRLSAYYYGFEPTGNEDVDRILAAVARAGKAYHHTENWSNEPADGASGPDWADVIQWAAIIASTRLTAANQTEAAPDVS